MIRSNPPGVRAAAKQARASTKQACAPTLSRPLHLLFASCAVLAACGGGNEGTAATADSDAAPTAVAGVEASRATALAVPAGPWTDCAREWGTCSAPGTVTLRYGANGAYLYKTVTGSAVCSNATFGGDPAVGVVKTCAYTSASAAAPAPAPAPAPGSTSWVACGNEWATCSVPSTRQVRYGANGSYVYKTVTGSIVCSNAAFGVDPIKGVAKSCHYDRGTAGPQAAPPPAPAPSPAPAPAPAPAVSGPQPLNVSTPTTVVGSGSAGSCTESALRTAVAAGGVVTFNCGSATTTIALSQPLVAPTDRDTTIDGANRIVLDGQNATQILRAYRADFRVNDRTLAVQRLAMTRGRDVGSNYVARNGSSTCAWGYKDGGGGAITTRDVNLYLWGVTFEGNRGPDIGPDVAGGAVYVFGAKRLTVNNSTFRNNTASNGGAIGLLHADATVYNTVFENNRALGQLANFGGASGCPVFNHAEQGGAGGLGGAFYSDGFNTNDVFFNVRMSDNAANHLGGAVFRSAYWGMGWGKQTITWESSRFERNRTPTGGGGAAYVNNSLFSVRGSTFNANDTGGADGGALKITGATVQISDSAFTNNRATVGGGIAHWSGGPEGVGSSARLTFSGNLPNETSGVFPR